MAVRSPTSLPNARSHATSRSRSAEVADRARPAGDSYSATGVTSRCTLLLRFIRTATPARCRQASANASAATVDASTAGTIRPALASGAASAAAISGAWPAISRGRDASCTKAPRGSAPSGGSHHPYSGSPARLPSSASWAAVSSTMFSAARALRYPPAAARNVSRSAVVCQLILGYPVVPRNAASGAIGIAGDCAFTAWYRGLARSNIVPPSIGAAVGGRKVADRYLPASRGPYSAFTRRNGLLTIFPRCR
jgi:hypothetical protein